MKKPYGSPVVGYVRSARLNDPELDQAEAAIRAYAHEHGYNLVKVFREEGISSVATWRPQFEQLLRGLERGEWVGVILPDGEHLSTVARIEDGLKRKLHNAAGWSEYLTDNP
jgi:hypothetical protein